MRETLAHSPDALSRPICQIAREPLQAPANPSSQHIQAQRTTSWRGEFKNKGPELEERLHNVNLSLSNWITSLKLLQFLLSLKAKSTQEKRAERKHLKEKQWQIIQLEKVPSLMSGQTGDYPWCPTKVGGSVRISQDSIER